MTTIELITTFIWVLALGGIASLIVFLRKELSISLCVFLPLLIGTAATAILLIVSGFNNLAVLQDSSYFKYEDTEYSIEDKAAVNIVPLINNRTKVILVDYKHELDTVYDVYKDECKYKTEIVGGKEYVVLRRYTTIKQHPWVFGWPAAPSTELLFIRK